MDEDRTRLLAHPFVAAAARWGVVAWAGIGILLFGYIVFRYVLYEIRIIFPPLAVALILVYLLNPIVSRLATRMPRIVAALLTYLVFLSLVGAGLAYLIPVFADQVAGFARSVPGLVGRAVENVQGLAARFGFRLQAGALLTSESQQAVLSYLGQLLSLTRGLLHFALVVVLGPILAFYLLVDLPKMQRGVVALVPERRRAGFLSVMDRLGRVLGGFFRGQLLVSLFVGLASAAVLFFVGLPYWAVVGMVTGLFNLIPLVGPWIGGILAVFIAFTTVGSTGGVLHLDPGWPLAIGSAIGLTIVQQIDNHVISPNVVARTVRLHPVTVMLALLAGGTLLGLWGMLLAVPSVAGAKVLLLHAWDTRMTWPPPRAGQPAPDGGVAGPEAVPEPAGRRGSAALRGPSVSSRAPQDEPRWRRAVRAVAERWRGQRRRAPAEEDAGQPTRPV